MEAVVSRSATGWPDSLRRLEPDAVGTGALTGPIWLYLAIDGGGYDVVVRSQVAIVVWWIVLIGAAWGLLPASRWTRTAWAALALFGAFVAWSALATTWSLSSEGTLEELSRVAFYFGLLLLATSIHRDRGRAVEHTIHPAAAAAPLLPPLALASRLRPDLFPAAYQTASFLPGTQGRLGWPLNYWNALAALMALGLPLLLAIATSARTLRGQAAAAGAIPIVTLCGYLTFSRGGAVSAAVGLLAFLALSPERVGKLDTAVVTAAGSAALILAAVHRSAIEQGLTSSSAHHEGNTMLVSIFLVCIGVALAHLHASPRPGAAGGWRGGLRGRGAARRSAVANRSRLAGLQEPDRCRAAAGLDRALRERERERPLRLLEGGDRRHQRPPARGLWPGNVPAAVDPPGAVLQLRPERTLAVRRDARRDRPRRARFARGFLRVGIGGGGHGDRAFALRGEGARGRADRGPDRVPRGSRVGLALADPGASRRLPAPQRRGAGAVPRLGTTRARITAAASRCDWRGDRVPVRDRHTDGDRQHRPREPGGGCGR